MDTAAFASRTPDHGTLARRRRSGRHSRASPRGGTHRVRRRGGDRRTRSAPAAAAGADAVAIVGAGRASIAPETALAAARHRWLGTAVEVLRAAGERDAPADRAPDARARGRCPVTRRVERPRPSPSGRRQWHAPSTHMCDRARSTSRARRPTPIWPRPPPNSSPGANLSWRCAPASATAGRPARASSPPSGKPPRSSSQEVPGS